ncbi:hypothetical protein RS022_03260 [Candidatus Phytoplasma rubi]|uniref:Sequence-variable mosaic (SVM) signal sequence domain-containing protein n=1 Tax=Candidatus Phytoplasma rubi TaxID=399025 RepID=A0ABY7BRE1_9MOLU|nr:hypothetical protein [Candidatus Phytoplasma rubi]WAN63264.1 hypothetical protein RS022_03260 [Candidatus Phytoplasma rubi]
MKIIQKYSPYICLIIFTLTTIIICNFNNDNLKKHINLQNQYLKQKFNLIEKEMNEFQQETQSNFKKINENIDKLEKMIINQNKSNQESE